MTRKTEQGAYTFTLVLSGLSEVTEDVGDALFEAGCDDALLGVRDGVAFLEFDRRAASLGEAILSAIENVAKARIGASVARVEPDDMVTASEIARRVHRTRENIRQLMNGTRGPGGFPPAVSCLRQRSPIWRWAEVASWFADNYDLEDAERSWLEHATIIGGLNSVLELHRHIPKASLVTQLWGALRLKERPERATLWRSVLSKKRTTRGKAAR